MTHVVVILPTPSRDSLLFNTEELVGIHVELSNIQRWHTAGTAWASYFTLQRLFPSLPNPLFFFPSHVNDPKWNHPYTDLCVHIFVCVHNLCSHSGEQGLRKYPRKKKQLYTRHEHVEITLLRHQPSRNSNKAIKYIQKTRKTGSLQICHPVYQ